MALKFVIDTLDGLKPDVREHYTAKDGKYHLTLDGGHPDTARVVEFRDNNTALKKDLARFDGIDPDVVKAEKAKLTEYETAKPNERISTLEAQLAEANKRASGAILKDVITSAFFKAGGRANAADYILSKATAAFAVENGAVVGTVFDPNRPGEKITIDAFMEQQLRDADFAFKPSSGGGANPVKGAGGARGGAKELRNPDARALGQHAKEISEGKLRVVYDNE